MFKKHLAVATIITLLSTPLPAFANEIVLEDISAEIVLVEEVDPETPENITSAEVQDEEVVETDLIESSSAEILEMEENQELVIDQNEEINESIEITTAEEVLPIELEEKPIIEIEEISDTEEPISAEILDEILKIEENQGPVAESDLDLKKVLSEGIIIEPEINPIAEPQEPTTSIDAEEFTDIEELTPAGIITPEIEELPIIEEHIDLKIKKDTKIYLNLEDGQAVKLSSNVEGGVNIVIQIYSDDVLVGIIDSGVVTLAVEFLPEDVYAVINGEPGSLFDVQFSFSAIENITENIEATEPITLVKDSNGDFNDIIGIEAETSDINKNNQLLDATQVGEVDEGNSNLPVDV